MSEEEWARYLAPVGIWRDLASAAQKDFIGALAAVRADEREACAKVAEQQAQDFLSPEYATGQPFSSFSERFACGQIAKAIRAQSAKDKADGE